MIHKIIKLFLKADFSLLLLSSISGRAISSVATFLLVFILPLFSDNPGQFWFGLALSQMICILILFGNHISLATKLDASTGMFSAFNKSIFFKKIYFPIVLFVIFIFFSHLIFGTINIFIGLGFSIALLTLCSFYLRSLGKPFLSTFLLSIPYLMLLIYVLLFSELIKLSYLALLTWAFTLCSLFFCIVLKPLFIFDFKFFAKENIPLLLVSLFEILYVNLDIYLFGIFGINEGISELRLIVSGLVIYVLSNSLIFSVYNLKNFKNLTKENMILMSKISFVASIAASGIVVFFVFLMPIIGLADFNIKIIIFGLICHLLISPINYFEAILVARNHKKEIIKSYFEAMLLGSITFFTLSNIALEMSAYIILALTFFLRLYVKGRCYLSFLKLIKFS